MRTGIRLFLIVAACSSFVMSSPLWAAFESAEELFLQANDHYKEKEFKKSLQTYKKIEHKSPQVFYNMGNCAYQLGSHGYALLYWRKAEKNWGLFNRSELLKNIILVKKKLEPVDPSKPPSGLRKLASRLSLHAFSMIKGITLLWLQFLVLLIWLFLFIYLRYLHRSGQKAIITILFTLLACSSSVLALKYGLKYRKYGVIVRSSSSLSSGPGKTFQVLGKLNEGKEVRISSKSDDYYKISFKGTIGWVHEHDIEIV